MSRLESPELYVPTPEEITDESLIRVLNYLEDVRQGHVCLTRQQADTVSDIFLAVRAILEGIH